jgi:predicted nucleic acid-binding Zn ribbon protein
MAGYRGEAAVRFSHRAEKRVAPVSCARARCYIVPSVLHRPAIPHVTRKRLSGPGQPQSVGDVLTGFLNRSGLAPKVEAAAVIPEWEQRVGPGIAAVTEPLRVSEGTLIVAVRTSAWLMELNMMKGELMRHVNAGKTAGHGRIEQIIFVMAGG